MKYIIFSFFLFFVSCNNSSEENIPSEVQNKTDMKVLGLLGGTSWHSTVDYYKFINESVNQHFGDNTNPPLLVFTMNQSLIHKYQVENNWDGIADILIEGGLRLEKAGAEQLMFCANTPHKVYNQVSEKINIPIMHIGDVTATEIQKQGIKKVLFLGTKYTMTEDFIVDRMTAKNIEVLVPEQNEQIEELHRIIIKELTYGNIEEDSKKYVLDVIYSFIEKGAEGVILGCTEFPLMIKEEDLNIPIFNTTEIHARSGLDFILSDLRK